MTEQKKSKKRNKDDIAHRAKNGKTSRDLNRRKTIKFKQENIRLFDLLYKKPKTKNDYNTTYGQCPRVVSRKASKSQHRSKYTNTTQRQSTTDAKHNKSETFGLVLRQSKSFPSDAHTHENCDVDADDLSLSTGDDSYCAKKDTYSASIVVTNLRNIIAEKDAVIEELTQQIQQLTQQNKTSHTQSPPHSPSIMENRHSVVENFQTELAVLLTFVNGHFTFIDQQSLKVDKEIARLHSKVSLKNAKKKALKREKDLMRGILSPWSNMTIFLNDIILIENLLNSLYQPLQAEQWQARQMWARNISIYEGKSKPLCEVQSFVGLLLESLHIIPFKKLLRRVHSECKKQGIKIKHNSGAQVKGIERAFYKAFYVYSDDKMKGYEQMTDVVRCSLVFNNFRNIYQTFSIIEQLSTEYGGILRCKDRFNAANVLFGYRDLSINIYCPSSHARIVCEIQLHHQSLYKHKDLAHSTYTKARLFQQKDGGNGAYKYAQKYLKTKNRDKIYQVAGTFDDEKQMVATNSNKHKFQSQAKAKLTAWGLEEYYDVLVKQYGYDDIADWNRLSIDKLKTMKFKQGHSEKFLRKVSGTNII